jgi:hypothetical protein
VTISTVIRNAILHIQNEQPMLADLFEAPGPGDIGLRCTNLRTNDGKRPVFIEDSSSVFFFPYLHIRFVEIPAASLTGTDPSFALELQDEVLTLPAPVAEAEPDLEIDEDFLRRIREV